jgi:hypothetical protein
MMPIGLPQSVDDYVDRLKQPIPGRRRPETKSLPETGNLPETRSLPSGRMTDEPPPEHPAAPLVRHMLATYGLLRVGMGWLAIAYPFVLVGLGLLWFKVAWQPSISDYYYALDRALDLPAACQVPRPAADCAAGWPAKAVEMAFPLRSIFCGGLISVGVFLVLYKGTSWLEDVVLNLAGACAIGVAIFPMNKTPFVSTWPTWLHFASAALLFVCMWFICRFCAKDTLVYFGSNQAEIDRYTRLYKNYSMAMVAVLAAGGVYGINTAFFDRLFPSTLFCIEAFGVVVFGAYWVIKSREIAKHDFGLKGL